LIEGHRTQDLIDLVTSLDLGIKDIQMIKTPVAEFPGVISYEVKTAHWKYDVDGSRVDTEYFELDEDEPAGTHDKRVRLLNSPCHSIGRRLSTAARTVGTKYQNTRSIRAWTAQYALWR
jgi:hypothetical protein